MKKIILLISLFIYFTPSIGADSTCRINGNIIRCTEDRPIDYEKAGQGLRNILRWLNENSTTNSNSNNNSGYLIPRNASPSGNGWLCDYNYHINSSNTGCQKVPANAYSLKNNNNWFCISGYKRSGNSCIKKITIPANAYASGSDWKCLSGYKKSGNSCIKQIYIPPNAYASEAGWYCRVGYTKSGNSCVKNIYVPPNGYASGNSFKCLTGYKKSGNSCIKEISLPANAIADGDGFKCKIGFYKEYGTSCKKIPTSNAYAYGITWLCDFGYIKSGNQCLKKEKRPENSYPISNGGWKCKVGFEKIGNECKQELTQLQEADSEILESKNVALVELNKEAEKKAEFLEKISQAKSLLDSGIISEAEFSDITKRIIEKSQENTYLNTLQLEDEEDLTVNQKAKLQSAWIRNIGAEVKSVWNFPGAEDGWFVEVLVTQNKEGKVLNVKSGDNNVGNSVIAKRFIDSVQRAVYKSSPLPISPDASVWQKDILFTFYP